MAPVTARRDGTVIRAPFAWSFSKLEGFESCPKQYAHRNVYKDVVEGKTQNQLYGDALHQAAANRLGPQKLKIPQELYDQLAPWIEKIEKIETAGGKIETELKLAITEDFAPTTWFGKAPNPPVWFRAIADVLAIAPSGKTALSVDWKTGKIKEDVSVQLALSSMAVFAHYPQIQAIRSEFIWLAHDATTREDFRREDIPKVWATILPRANKLRAAHEAREFPAKKSGLCKGWCPVKSCQFWQPKAGEE